MIVSIKNLSRETRIVFDIRHRAVIVPAGRSASPDLSDAVIDRCRNLPRIWEIGNDAGVAGSTSQSTGPGAVLNADQVSDEKAKTVFTPPRKERGAALSMPDEAEERATGSAVAAARAPAPVGAQFVPGAASGEDDGGIMPRPQNLKRKERA